MSSLNAFLKSRRGKDHARYFALAVFSFLGFLFILDGIMLERYSSFESVAIKDRHGDIILSYPNVKGDYANFSSTVPPRISSLLIKKEDRFFYEHLGINPFSIGRSFFRLATGGDPGGSSTLTQQLAKNLLGNESRRTLANKIKELLYTLALEVFESKERILTMYYNTVYLGNNIEGFPLASEKYFGKTPDQLDDSEIIMLLATISNPTNQNPWKRSNLSGSKGLAARLGIQFNVATGILKPDSFYIHRNPTAFEIETFDQACDPSCTSTIDLELTEKLRTILRTNVGLNWDAGARNGAIVVIKEPENELLAMVGSPNPESDASGANINMAIEPRPIGSTVKPFIYLNAFEKGLRPYSLVDDREYRFPIATGYPLYPKNYDGQYHGRVTLHESLSNSYNVPAVKTLEYVGLPDFYDFLTHTIDFVPLQDLDKYQYGIALGGLEMDPLTLAYYFSLFPNNGVLKPLQLFLSRVPEQLPNSATTRLPNYPTPQLSNYILPPMSKLGAEKIIADKKYVELVTKILNDRFSGVEQFGLKSSLNLSQDNYAVKTGTSRDYHDSWTVGYTPDFVVVVWLGNAENEPLKELSGQSGAGTIWNQTMELLMNSQYNQKTPFDFSEIAAIPIGESLDIGLPDDVISEHQNLMLEEKLILSPHEGDVVLLSSDTTIPFIASRMVSWYANGISIGLGEKVDFKPSKAGMYRISAKTPERTETINLRVIN